MAVVRYVYLRPYILPPYTRTHPLVDGADFYCGPQPLQRGLLRRQQYVSMLKLSCVLPAFAHPLHRVHAEISETGTLLDPLIRAHMKEVREAAGIEVYTVYLQVEKELLWSRILNRLKREPGRVKYNEDKREWMEATLNFYDNFLWDMVRGTLGTTPTTCSPLTRPALTRSEPRTTRSL